MTRFRFRIAASAMLAVSLLVPARCPATLSESERFYSEARSAMSRHANAEALALFRKAVEEDGSNLEARYHLGVLLSNNIATYPLAEEELLGIPDRAMRKEKGGRDDLIFRAGLALAKLYAKSGRNGLAIRLVRSVIASAPPTVRLDEAYTVLGLSLYYERMYDEAILELRRALKINPGNPAATFNLKTIRARLEHFNAARIYSRTGDHAGAIEEYRTSIALDPRFVEARYRLGMELLQVGENAEALRELRRAESVSGNHPKLHEILFGKGLALRNLRQLEEAREQFLAASRRKPAFAPALNEIGKIHLARKEHADAVRWFVEAIALDAKEEYASNLQAALGGQAGP